MCVVNHQFNLTQKYIQLCSLLYLPCFLGIGIGYVLRNWSILQKTEKTISLTIFLLLFILGVSIGSNSLIVNNLGKFGWQAIVLAVSGVLGSPIAARLVLQLFFEERRRTMKGSLIVIVFFCVGCIMGAFNKFEFDTHTVSMYILYALMLQVGISIGSNKNHESHCFTFAP